MRGKNREAAPLSFYQLYRRNLFIILLLLLNLLIFLKLKFFIPQLTGKTTLMDLDAYLRLIIDVKKGVNPYTVGYMQTSAPPTIFFYFLPFSVLPINAARSIFTLINVSCGILSCYLLASRFYPKAKIATFLLLNLIFFSSFPTRYSIETGQPNLVICYLISLLICRPKTKYPSVLLGLLIAIKTNYLVALTSIARINIKLVIKVALTLAFFIVLFLSIVKASFYSYYIFQKTKNVLPLFGENISLDYYNQSIPSTLSRLGVVKYQGGLYLLSILVLVYLTFRSSNLLLGFLSSIILSPVAWQHYFAALLPIFVIVFTDLKRNTTNTLLFITSVFLWWIEFPWLHQAPLNLLNGILASHYFFSALILIFLILSNSKKLSFMLK